MKIMIRILVLMIFMSHGGHLAMAQREEFKSNYDLGLEAFNEEDYPKAWIHFNEWIKESPQDPNGYWYMGQVTEKFDSQSFPLALENYSLALRLNPDLAGVYMSRGRLQLKMERFEAAEQDFQTYLKIPKGETTQIIYKRSSTASGFSGIFTPQSENPSGVLYHIGLCRIGLEDYSKALDYLDSAISLNPAEADYHAERGKALMEIGRNEEALLALKNALELQPKHYLARQRISLIKDGGDSEILEGLTQAISDEPENPQVWKLRGYHRLTHGDFEGANEDFSQAISLDLEDPENWNYRANAFLKLEEWEKAENDFTEAIRLSDQNPELFLGRGQSRYHQRKIEQAIADFTQVIAIDPQDASGYYHRGISMHRIKKSNEACNDLKRALLLGMEEAKPVLEKICE
ncbi:TPR repeat-containing protein [Algoriphagus faecimaris]|uniref:TPR repeat-containing protein n=1 Tax=Algoriphagus faecimaris TaxID=686796 RepID=A0A1G6SV42_9BACT|nr:tetratricopeptide repeat protein [Algoriphagus faecimaris]SDD20712.1 TPR repeat-containing protein [Algoriphagus faecimaris]